MNAAMLNELYSNVSYMKIINENNIFKLFKSAHKLNLSELNSKDSKVLLSSLDNLMMLEQFNLINILSKQDGMTDIVELLSNTNMVSFKYHIAGSP